MGSIRKGFFQNVADYIAGNEGYSARAYVDRGGRHAVGYGFNETPDRREAVKLLGLDPDQVWGHGGMDQSSARKMLNRELIRNEAALRRRFKFYGGLPEPVKIALHDHVYNMGVGVKFPKMEKALETGDWETAAKEMAAISPKNPAGVRERAARRAQLVRSYAASVGRQTALAAKQLNTRPPGAILDGKQPTTGKK